MESKRPAGSFRTLYDFRFDVLDVIVGGRSMIDSPEGFHIRSAEEAGRFVESYGFDLENPIERAELLGNYHEALAFIRRHFLQPDNPDGLRIDIPRRIVELTDIRDLLLMASLQYPGQGPDLAGLLLKNWACALLKVMHTIAHIDKDLRSTYFSDIQQQILDRFYKVIHRDHDHRLYLGASVEDPLRVDLVAFETKPKKSRDSIILKLLHKPENVAEDIFDRVGLRFVTHTRLGALQVVKYLKDNMIVMPPNIKPSRSRNTLVDMDFFKTRLTEVFAQASPDHAAEQDLLAEVESAAVPPQVNPDNPHSSEFYRALQFTVRQLIKIRNPVFDELKELKSLARKSENGDPELMKAVDRIDLKHLQRDVRFFYPFEVQIVDASSAEENERGRSAHSEYKRSQVQTAMRRVMGPLCGAP